MDIEILRKRVDEMFENIDGENNKNDGESSLKEQLKKLNESVKNVMFKQDEYNDNFKNMKSDLYIKVKKDMNCKYLFISFRRGY